jgi:hypothetical protein
MRPLKSFKQLLWPIWQDIESNGNTPTAIAPFPDAKHCDVKDAVTVTRGNRRCVIVLFSSSIKVIQRLHMN